VLKNTVQKTGVWTTIADLNCPRKHAAVVTLDGLLYVVGGMNKTSHFDDSFINKSSLLDSVERYNPNTNTWTMVTAKFNIMRFSPGEVETPNKRYSFMHSGIQQERTLL